MAAVRDALQSTLVKLQAAERDNLRRVEALELRLAERWDAPPAGSVQSRQLVACLTPFALFGLCVCLFVSAPRARVRSVAASVDSRVEKSMESRLSFIEAALKRNFEKFRDEVSASAGECCWRAVDGTVARQYAPALEDSVAEKVAARGDARGWVTPFIVLCLAGAASAACIGFQYRRISKTLKKHHLP